MVVCHFFSEISNRPGRNATIFNKCPIARGDLALFFQNLFPPGAAAQNKTGKG